MVLSAFYQFCCIVQQSFFLRLLQKEIEGFDAPSGRFRGVRHGSEG